MFLESIMRLSAPGPADDFWYGGAAPRTTAGVAVDENVAMTYSACWAATRLLSGTGAMLPLNLYKERPGGGSDMQPNHTLHKLLHDSPNPEMSAMMWRATGLNHQINWGNSYSEIQRDAMGRVAALWPIHPSRVTLKARSRDATAGKSNLYYEVRGSTGPTSIEYGEMFHVPSMMSDDGRTGKGVIAVARESIGHGLATERYGSAWFGNGARPSAILKHPTKLDKTAREHLRREWNEIYQGPGNSNKVAVLWEGMTYEALSTTPEDSQFIASREHNVETIARWYGVPPHLIADLRRATFCLPASEPVFTENGPKSIADVCVGEKVWSYSSDGQWVLSEVTAAGCSGTDDIIAFHTRTRTLRCNRGHRVLVRRQVLVPYVSGRGKYIVVGGKKCRKAYAVEYIEAGDIRVGDQLVSAHGLPDTGNEMTPTRKATVKFMEALGMITGDGFMVRSGRGRHQYVAFGLSHGENTDYIGHYVEAIEGEFTASAKPYDFIKNKAAGVDLKSKRRDKNTTMFNSTSAAAELEQLGISGTAHTKRVPSWVFGMSHELKMAYIRGYLDADGTVNKNGQVSFASCNQLLLEDVRHLLISVGVRCGRIHAYERVSRFPGYPEKASMYYSLACSDPGSAVRIGSHTGMYHERWSAAIAKKPERVCRVYPNEALKVSGRDGVQYETVNEIEHEAMPEKVYDLTVSGTHSFIANGLVVHNSNIEHMGIEFVKYSLMPWLKLWEQEIARKLLTDAERSAYYAKHVVDALERGDATSRTAALKDQFFNGKITINEWRRLDDQNPIDGPEGDAHFVQSAMVPLDVAAKGPQPKEAPVAPTAPAEPPADKAEPAVPAKPKKPGLSASYVRRALKKHAAEVSEVVSKLVGKVLERKADPRTEQAAADTLAGVVERMLAKEGNAAIRAAEKPGEFPAWRESFYAKHREALGSAINREVVLGLAVLGDERNPFDVVEAIAAEHCAKSVADLDACESASLSEFPATVTACVERWKTERTKIDLRTFLRFPNDAKTP